MKLLDFLLKANVTGSNTLGRVAVVMGRVTVNGKTVGFSDLARDGADLKAGDVVTFGRKTLNFTSSDE